MSAPEWRIGRASCTAPRQVLQLIRPLGIARAALAASLVLTSALTFAQTGNPRIVEFQPSVDHSRTDNGVPVVDRYELQFYLVGSSAVLQAIDLGKPTPGTDGVIRVDFSGQLGAWPAAGPVYEARVVAIGSGGAGVSAVSNTFDFPSSPPPPAPPPCTYSVTPTSRTMSATGTTSSFSVTTGATCTWTPVSSSAWLIPSDSSTRVGNGTVSYRTVTNTATAARSGTIQIATATFAVTQSGACNYSVTPTSRGFNSAGGTASVAVTATSGCTWTAVRAGTWITITSGASGTGNGTVGYRVSANSTSSSRSGTITIAGLPVTISQSAPTAPNPPAGLRVVVVR